MTVLDELSDTDEPSACEESVTGVDVTASPVLAYMAALDAAVVSSGTNRAPLSTCALPDDAAASFIERWSAPLVSSIAAAPGAGGPEFTSVAAAKRRDDWLGEGGFREAVKAEIERVTTHFNAVTVVTASEVRAARRKWPAPGKVAIQHIVFPGKVKTNASGDITRRKARWTIADRVADGKVPGTFSANVSASSTRLLSQLLVVLPGAVATTSDVAGAYFNGKPKPPEEDGGRVLFTPIPKGWDEFGYKQHNERGERLFFRVDSNMPGRQEAGAVWEAEYTAKLKEWGFTQSTVDRRVFMQFDDDGLALVVGVFVDDNWILSQSPKLLAQFTERWMSEYDCAPDMAATKTEFCGVGMVRKDEDTVELHVDGTIDLLGESLTPYGYAGSCAEPMHRDGLKHIQAPPSDDNPLQPPELHEAARRIMGRGGWVVTMVRPDAYFAFTALATQLAMNFTKAVWDGVLRWASYLVATKGLRLTYRRQRNGAPWVTFSDSSVLNAGAGQSFGGHCSCYEGSGLLNWRCFVPRRLSDSSAAAELIVATSAAKWILGQRMLSAELRQGQEGPSPLYLDAQATLQGTAAEKVSRDMKYMAARYAILRQTETSGEVVLRKVHTTDNLADLFTKPLSGDTFRRLRDRAMGLAAWTLPAS